MLKMYVYFLYFDLKLYDMHYMIVRTYCRIDTFRGYHPFNDVSLLEFYAPHLKKTHGG